MMKKILLLIGVFTVLLMPICSAENWTLYLGGENYDDASYVDLDSAWYDGKEGGFLDKYVFNFNSTSNISVVQFRDDTETKHVNPLYPGAFWVRILKTTWYDENGNVTKVKSYDYPKEFYCSDGHPLARAARVVKKAKGY
ncbi:hypothetical protein [Selenomonas sp.]|jgi:hypothetical protein|uniref:hypothetical protein n=1 Tax=Selenomonas sp. TaxID=2053611 RepID=UPI0025F98020|nr:hypothetical protein [Selenomonas sp.]MCI6283729.1 hypothetical protein [Selenomonas sp.]